MFLYPRLFKIVVKFFPSGNFLIDSFKYEYALRFFENNFPMPGVIQFMYKLYNCFTPIIFGFVHSSTTNLPPGFKTLFISLKPFSRFSKLRTPKATVTASNELSAKFIVSQSPFISSILLDKPKLRNFLSADLQHAFADINSNYFISV